MEEEEYKKMYFHLFNETQKAIELLQKAHTDWEEMFYHRVKKKIATPKSDDFFGYA